MTIGQILFSFRGRSPRRHYWALMLAPMLIGIVLGGMVTAQSMIGSAKKTGFCNEAVQKNQYHGNCTELSMLARQYHDERAINNAQSNLDIAAKTCLDSKKYGIFTGDCLEAIPLIQKIPAEEASGAEELPLGNANDQLLSLTKILSAGIIIIILTLIGCFLFCWASLAITCKRLHDRNMSGWWQLAPLGLAILAIIPFAGFFFALASYVVYFGLWIICMFMPGNDGANNYGMDPKEKHTPLKIEIEKAKNESR